MLFAALFAIAVLLIGIGGFVLFRGRAWLHWRRGYRNLSSWQRKWLIRKGDVLSARVHGAAFAAAGALILLAALQWASPPAPHALFATLAADLDAGDELSQHPAP